MDYHRATASLSPPRSAKALRGGESEGERVRVRFPRKPPRIGTLKREDQSQRLGKAKDGTCLGEKYLWLSPIFGWFMGRGRVAVLNEEIVNGSTALPPHPGPLPLGGGEGESLRTVRDL